MMILTAENVVPYVLKNTTLFHSDQVMVKDISEYNPEEEKDGFVNFIFKVYDQNQSVIVKQARPYLKYFGEDFQLTTSRNIMEYETLKLRGEIVPEYVPKTYFVDLENNVFIMEDLSYLNVMRYQLNRMIRFPKFGRQAGEYLAKCNFYTSELYWNPETHRRLQAAFINPDMRSIMENAAFVRSSLSPLNEDHPNQRLVALSKLMWSKDDVVLACYQMRDIFMKRGECLLHGDLHTSNIFVGPEHMKVIDMEYTFMGPYSFDMGYLFGNLISQYCAFSFKRNLPMSEREAYCEYLLNTIKEIYETYVEVFYACCEKDLKESYRGVKGYVESIIARLLPEAMGFAGCSNMIRMISLAGYPDFDVIENPIDKENAETLDIVLDHFMLLNNEDFNNIDQLIESIREVRRSFIANNQ